MNTDELIAILAADATPVEPRTAARRFRSALGWGLFATTLLMALTFGGRSDISEAAQLPFFWVKLALPAIAAILTLMMAERLGRPGMRLGVFPLLLLILLGGLWTASAGILMGANPEAPPLLIFGRSWEICLASIALLSIPLFIASMWAMKGLAPTKPAYAGGAAGLLAGTLSAAVYALHCPDMALPFIAIWYVLGMLIPAAIGFLMGGRLLRW